MISAFRVNEYLMNRRIQKNATKLNAWGIHIWEEDQIKGIVHKEAIFTYGKEVIYYIECYHNDYYIYFDFFRDNFHIFFHDMTKNGYAYDDLECEIYNLQDKLKKIVPNQLQDEEFMGLLTSTIEVYKSAFMILKDNLVYSQGI